MKVVAFMQNMWVKNPAFWRAAIAQAADPEKHRRAVIRRLLFYKCITGRRLMAALGEWCDCIVWEESTREIAGDPKTIFPAQPEHIRTVLEELAPAAVLTFGKIAAAAVEPLWPGLLFKAPHPAARQATVPAELQRVAAWLDELELAEMRADMLDEDPRGGVA